jgi:nucleotide-binding universal stress UspA family protein
MTTWRLPAATKASASLPVMGGYGRSRLREFVFGCFTSSVLETAHLPIFIAH